jgi:uncharacterized protein involved in cysteine biosynthesis
MISAFSRSIAQIGDPALRRLFWASLAIGALCFVALLAAAWFALPWLEAALPAGTPGWLAAAAQVVAAGGAVLLAAVMFPGTVIAIQSALFVEPVSAAVERRHYPDLPAPRGASAGEQAAIALRQVGVAIGLNLLALPIYLVPVVNVAAFAALNGYLLSRDLFFAVAARRMDRAAATRLWRARRRWFWVAGIPLALLMAVPVANLAGPLLGAAAMTHLVEAARRAT